MYHTIRRLHLFAGLTLLLFVLMYFITGYIIIHNQWFGDNKPVLTTRKESLSYSGPPSEEELSKYLQAAFDLPGKRQPPVRQGDGVTRFNFVRPGTAFEAVVSADQKQVTITRRDMKFANSAGTLHRIHGYGGGRFYYLWAFVYDLASAAMILFAVSGVYLWYKSTTVRLPGWICLGAASAFTASMILYLLHAR